MGHQTSPKKFFHIVSKDEEQEKFKAILGNESGSDFKEDLKEHVHEGDIKDDRSFFVRKAPLSTSSTSDGDGSKNSPSPIKKVKTPKEKKEKTPKEKKVKTPIEKKVKTPFEKKDQKSIIEEKAQVQSSPLREANQIQDDNEASLDSPIKKTK